MESAEEIAGHYEERDYGRAVRKIMALADQVNQYVDRHQPWVLAKSSEHDARLHHVCSMLINAFRLLTLYLRPILPRLARRAEEFLNVAPLRWSDAGHLLPPAHPVNAYEHLMTRIDPKQVDALSTATPRRAVAAITPSTSNRRG
jgi:methionyl-tRNA synthetase